MENPNKSVTALITLLNLADTNVEVNASIGENEVPDIQHDQLFVADELAGN